MSTKTDTQYLTTLRTAWTHLYLNVEWYQIYTNRELRNRATASAVLSVGTNNACADLPGAEIADLAGRIASHMIDRINNQLHPNYGRAEILGFLEAQRANVSDQLNSKP